jgi:hypothetical protein
MKNNASGATGRARATLVFGEGEHAKAVIVTVVARATGRIRSSELHFSGPVTFETRIAKHISDVILPIVNMIAASLGLGGRRIDLCVVNPGAASVFDIGVQIDGFSADVPVFLALLSACIQLPLPVEMVSTGHIASGSGDISAVGGLQTKLSVASGDESIKCFLCPALGEDHSLRDLCPGAAAEAYGAISNARRKLRVVTVSNIADLAHAVFTDEAILSAALKGGFLSAPSAPVSAPGPVEEVVRFLAEGNEKRFWDVLERHLLRGNSAEAKDLLYSYTQAYIREKVYPAGFGRRLAQLVGSLPPATRRLRLQFPLLDTSVCVKVGQFAVGGQVEDIRLLLDATAGKVGSEAAPLSRTGQTCGDGEGADAEATLDILMSEIDEVSLAETVGLPIDTARATYVLDSATVDSHDEFLDTISAFYLRVCRHVHPGACPADIEAARDEAVALIEGAFAGRGGLEAALAEARTPVHGGMRYVLDVMADRLKAERQIKHVNRVFKEALDPLDSLSRTSLMAAFLRRIGPALPEEIRAAPPERFAKHYEVIVKTYVESLNRVKEVLRTL